MFDESKFNRRLNYIEEDKPFYSLVSLYNHFWGGNTLDIEFPSRVVSENNMLKAENKDIVIQLIPDKQLLKVEFKHTPEKNKNITLKDTHKLRLSTAPSYIRLFQDWVFDSQNGLIINGERDIIVYAPTASSQNFIGLNILVDYVKTPNFGTILVMSYMLFMLL